MRKIIIALILALVTLVGVCLPASAEATPPSTTSPKDFWVCLNGTNYGSSKIVDGALIKDISVTCQSWGDTYKVDIPKGTRVVVVPEGATVINSVLLEVYVYRDIVTTTMSNCALRGRPVSVYELVNGEWVKIGKI